MPEFTLTSAPPLTVAPGPHGREGAGSRLCLTALKARAMVQVMARRNRHEELTELVRDRYGLVLPNEPKVVRGDRVSFLWAGRHQWLAVAAEEEAGGFLGELRTVVHAAASLSDQSDARFAVTVTGLKVRDALAKLVPIDLHPAVFRHGQTALTLFGHMGGQITHVDELPTFELMVFRGFAQSLWHALLAAGAEFGIDVLEPSVAGNR